MTTKEFTIRDGKMLYWRLGNINSNKQKHFGKTGHQPPTSRGLWCFPYPHYDYFFVYQQWEKKLPKKYRETDWYVNFIGSDEEKEKASEDRETILRGIIKSNPPTTFWYEGDFYSHIDYHGNVSGEDWWLWDCAKDWAKIAQKRLYLNERINGKVYRLNYSKDSLEIFIPNF